MLHRSVSDNNLPHYETVSFLCVLVLARVRGVKSCCVPSRLIAILLFLECVNKPDITGC